jgi:hypothetical protein
VIEGQAVEIETLPEIITKKICYRGGSIKPRDIFDIAAAAETQRVEIIEALQRYRADVETSIKQIERLNPQFVRQAIADLAIKEGYKNVAETAIERATELLKAV